jgi:hypothetical protein
MNDAARTSRPVAGSLGIALVLAAGAARADDLRGAERFLCSTMEVKVCFADDGCLPSSPEDLNIPQFIVVDAEAGKLETTPASGERRETKAGTVARAEGLVQLQGREAGRAFSLVISETTGRATFASAADERAVVVFAACTPAPGE